MELFEVLNLVAILVEACGCFLELGAVGSGVATGVSAAKAHKNKVARKAAQEAGVQPPPATGWRWAFWGLLALTAFLVGLVIWKWTR